jgi:hypothetical protein
MKKKDSFIEDLRKIFVSIETFNLKLEAIGQRLSPLEKIVYGATGLILITVLGAALAFLMKK